MAKYGTEDLIAVRSSSWLSTFVMIVGRTNLPPSSGVDNTSSDDRYPLLLTVSASIIERIRSRLIIRCRRSHLGRDIARVAEHELSRPSATRTADDLIGDALVWM